MKTWLRTIVTLSLLLPGFAQGVALVSPHYRLDPNVSNSFGGSIGSPSYKLTDAGGEAAVGSGSSSSYRLSSGYVAELAQSIQLSILPSGISAYYPLDTGQGGQVYDNSANNNQGSLVAVPIWTAGKLGQALSFDGTTQYATVPSSASLNLTGDITLSAWVNLADLSVQHEIISKRVGTGAANTTYELRIQQTTGQLQFLAYDTALRTVTGTTPVPTGSWAQVAAVKSGGSVTLYLNGVAISTPGSVATSSTNANAMKLGSNDDLTNFLKGSLDEVKIYNRALTQKELANDVAAVNASSASTQSIPSVIPGASQTASSDVVVRTDAAGYILSIAEDHDLLHTDTVTTIAAIAAAIALPATWSEGTTKGLGFTLTGGGGIEAAWGTGPYNYAALPTVATAFHSRNGFLGGAPDVTTMQYRLDTTSGQKSGSYSNTVTITATLKP